MLHTSKPLQKLLGVTEVAHGHLLNLVRQLHSQGGGQGGMLAKMGTPWLAQLLLCVFDSLAQVSWDTSSHLAKYNQKFCSNAKYMQRKFVQTSRCLKLVHSSVCAGVTSINCKLCDLLLCGVSSSASRLHTTAYLCSTALLGQSHARTFVNAQSACNSLHNFLPILVGAHRTTLVSWALKPQGLRWPPLRARL